ncbi:MAG: hypothetical protein WCE50_01005 [Candidatus Acidiferrum sp.]
MAVRLGAAAGIFRAHAFGDVLVSEFFDVEAQRGIHLRIGSTLS